MVQSTGQVGMTGKFFVTGSEKNCSLVATRNKISKWEGWEEEIPLLLYSECMRRDGVHNPLPPAPSGAVQNTCRGNVGLEGHRDARHEAR